MDANELKNRQPSETKFMDHLPGPSVMDDSGTIESDWKEVVENFHEMNLKEELLRGIYEYGFKKPSAIQLQIISQCIKGHDVTVQAQSVTGKTTAVVISILQQINTSLNECQALILVPSYELARPIQKVVNALGKFMKADCHACTGLKNIHDCIRKLDTFPHIVVGTPACVYNLIYGNILQTQFIKIFVLDKANLMLYRRYKFHIIDVFKSLDEDTQVFLLSNQMSEKALNEGTRFVSNPVRIVIPKEELTLETFKQFYINNSYKNETQHGSSSESNDYYQSSEPPSMDVCGTMESYWKYVVDNFYDMNLKEELLCGIYECGFEKPSPIQQRIILACINGHDVIVQAQSSTGKITAVLISILQQIDTSLSECQALILTPTGKKALQIQKVVTALGKYIKPDFHACIGVKNIGDYICKPDTVSPSIVVGTPTCVSDLITLKSLRTQFIKIFVLDKANSLLSCSVKVQIKKMFDSLEKVTQVILLSYRMCEKALDESAHFMSYPVHIFMQNDIRTFDSNLEGLKHFFVHLTKEGCKFDSLCDLFNTLSITQVVIFCNTCYKVECLTESMRLKKFNVSAIHREIDRQQNSKTLFHFHSGSIRVLITTHTFVRTIDVQQVSLIINYDLPSDCENFIHNVERSRYVARKGVVLNFITENENQSIDTNNYSGPLVTIDSGTIESNWKDVVDNFHEMNLKEELLRGIYEYGFEKPSPIQQRVILPCIKGHDVFVNAQSGGGKTTSVLISILQQIDTGLKECQALILAPSQKLTQQIHKVVIAFGGFMKADCYACIHEIKMVGSFSHQPHIVVGTPTCVYNLIMRKCLRTKFIKIFVLDETYKSLNRCIKDQINEVFKVLERDTSIQVILLSDSMPEIVLYLSTHLLRNPVHIMMQK